MLFSEVITVNIKLFSYSKLVIGFGIRMALDV